MSDPESVTRRLLRDVAAYVAPFPGPVGRPTPVPRLMAWASTAATLPTSAIFEPMFYAVARGTKVLIMGANCFELSAGACAASSFGLPYSHQLAGGTHELPYVGISLHLDIGMLTRVMLDMPKRDDRWTCAVATFSRMATSRSRNSCSSARLLTGFQWPGIMIVLSVDAARFASEAAIIPSMPPPVE
jgi:hypothetical protein